MYGAGGFCSTCLLSWETREAPPRAPEASRGLLCPGEGHAHPSPTARRPWSVGLLFPSGQMMVLSVTSSLAHGHPARQGTRAGPWQQTQGLSPGQERLAEAAPAAGWSEARRSPSAAPVMVTRLCGVAGRRRGRWWPGAPVARQGAEALSRAECRQLLGTPPEAVRGGGGTTARPGPGLAALCRRGRGEDGGAGKESCAPERGAVPAPRPATVPGTRALGGRPSFPPGGAVPPCSGAWGSQDSNSDPQASH